MEFPRELLGDEPVFPLLAPSKTSVPERNVLYWLARDWFSGEGEIVDLGATVGGTAVPLCAGLQENSMLEAYQKCDRVHCFDFFGNAVSQSHWGRSIGLAEMGFADDRAAFEHFTSAYREYIRIHPGNFLERTWGGEPVELLHVDLCKSLPLWKHAWSEFGSRLRPGRSWLILQDFERSRLPWLTYSLAVLLPCMEIVGPVVSGTVYARLKREIPSELHEKIAADDFTLEERLAKIDEVHHILRGRAVVDFREEHLDAAARMKRVYCHFWFGDRQEAAALLTTVPEAYRSDFPVYAQEVESGKPLDLPGSTPRP